MSYTVNEAYNYSRNDKIEEWVHSFLRTVGNNIPFWFEITKKILVRTSVGEIR